MTGVPKCPKCGSQDIRKSSKKSIDVFFSWFSMHPNRCRNCRARFFLMRKPGVHELPASNS